MRDRFICGPSTNHVRKNVADCTNAELNTFLAAKVKLSGDSVLADIIERINIEFTIRSLGLR